MTKPISLADVAEASLKELIEMLIRDDFACVEAAMYAAAMRAFWEGDIPALESIVRKLLGATPSPSPQLRTALQWRLDLKMKNNLSPRSIEERKRSLKDLGDSQIADPLWAPELSFLLGECAYFGSSFEIANESFREAYLGFQQIGLHKKALKARFNMIAVESCLDTNKRLFAQYSLLAEEAISVGEFQIAGTAITNIAREFQTLGAFGVAHKHADRAIQLFATHSPGSRNYHLALLQRASVLFDLERIVEARLDLEEARTSSDPIVLEAAAVLTSKRDRDATAPDSENIAVPVWREVKDEVANGIRHQGLGALEAELLRILTEGPISRMDLLARVYGSEQDTILLENRLKNLLARVRKRYPGLVICENGSYALVDDAKPNWLKRSFR